QADTTILARSQPKMKLLGSETSGAHKGTEIPSLSLQGHRGDKSQPIASRSLVRS
ncbi:unnamed protein product, partial [Musa hybrid cultivar]